MYNSQKWKILRRHYYLLLAMCCINEVMNVQSSCMSKICAALKNQVI